MARGIFDLCCGMRTLLRHVGSSSLTKDRTWASCIGSVESLPLDPQGSPSASFLQLPAWAAVMEPSVQTMSLLMLFLSMGTFVVPNVGL